MWYRGDGRQTSQSAQQLGEDRLPFVKERTTVSFLLFKGQLFLSNFKIKSYIRAKLLPNELNDKNLNKKEKSNIIFPFITN